jgi:sialic acid synthase SpsE
MGEGEIMSKSLQIIAEFCQNHNGNPEILARMIDAAASAGATHAKIQHIYAEDVSFRPQFEEGLTVDGVVKSIKRPYRAEVERLSGLELSEKDCRDFIRRCGDVGLVPMTTCFSRIRAQEISDLGFREVKVASYDCASFQLLRELKKLFPRIVVSTGATFDDELAMAADLLRGHDFALLHCVTIYPTPLDQMNLARMELLGELAPSVGFSDHSLVKSDGVHAAKIAVHLGAEIVERHFTILEASETRDGPVSIRPEHIVELAEFAALPEKDREAKLDKDCPQWRQAIGNARRQMTDAEMLNRDYYRGRFASRRQMSGDGRSMIYNWEETPLSS